MTSDPRRAGTCSYLRKFLVVLPLLSGVSVAERDQGGQLKTVEHQLALSSYMIQRLGGEARRSLDAQLETLQTRFLEGVDEKLVEDAKAFMQRVISAYRQGVTSTVAVDSDVDESRYETKREELEAFHDAYLTLVEERGQAAREVLDEESFAARVSRAKAMAAQGQYEDAYALADGAYHQLIIALKSLRDRETIEYRLEFASPEEEYAYEIRRFESQKMLLAMIVAERPPEAGSLSLIETLVAQADARSVAARDFAESGQYRQAIDQQEAAVGELNKAMRLAGVYF